VLSEKTLCDALDIVAAEREPVSVVLIHTSAPKKKQRGLGAMRP
jgi:hypothetical protein